MNQQVDIPGVGIVEFPDYMSDADINAAAKRLHDEANPAAPSAKPSTGTAIKMAATAGVVPIAAREVMRFGTSPNAVPVAQAIGKVAGTVMSAPTSVTGIGSMMKGAEAGGKIGGWFTGMAQRAARPIAGAIERAVPYAQTLSTLSGAQGVLDLAQMAEPKRRDIGFLGVGASVTPDVAMLTAAVKKGANPTQAAAELTNGDPRKFAELITAYSRSLGQGQ